MSYRFRPAGRPEDRRAQPTRYRRATVGGMIIERDRAGLRRGPPRHPGHVYSGGGATFLSSEEARDIYRQPRPLAQTFHDESVNHGPHVIHTGGRFDSPLLVPRVPA